MNNGGLFSPLRWFSVLFLLAAVGLTSVELVSYSRARSVFAPEQVIAGVPVGGLDRQQAAQRLIEAYDLPVELRYGEAIIHLDPSVVDFQLDLEAMLAAAELQRVQQSFWVGFWDYLWNRETPSEEIPLRATFSEQRLRTYLQQEIAPRYDSPPIPPRPIVGTVNFEPGQPGRVLDIEAAIPPIARALYSLDNRTVVLPIITTRASRPAFQNLEILLKQTIDLSGFDGLTGLYLLDLQNMAEIHFGYRQLQSIAVKPTDIAFTASSLIKIPILVSVFRRIGEQPDPETLKLISDMIEKSGNEAADWLMDRVIASNRSPLAVTEDMRALGLPNTFLAGYFYAGAPLLEVIKTPANQRTDVFTDPDPYSQTTPSEIGMLLEDIYLCAENGGGSLMAVFPGQITQEECQQMIEVLARNNIGVLIEAGVPDGTRVAHKHGWVSVNGIINTISDAGIVYTPGGNYVLVIFLYHPQQLIWEPASKLVADLSRAVYNYYNIPR
ncbi:MAG: class A beta-lactamase-related serine hydrolase [Anaerolineales bacterium]|nr:class A beta-lactamase-related serine hydrolase [Anaerolineales bacterium]MDW8161593.1 serine hydrolase [Anaerolineales bacterium]